MPIPIASIWGQLNEDAKRGAYNLKYAKALYDFSVDGGAIAAIQPKNNAILPAKAIVIGGIIDVLTTPTSGGGATVAIGTSAGSSATSIKGATAIASYTGLVATVPVFTAASSFKMTADGFIIFTVASFVLTAGKIGVELVYIIGD